MASVKRFEDVPSELRRKIVAYVGSRTFAYVSYLVD